jgi:hypothetical protein
MPDQRMNALGSDQSTATDFNGAEPALADKLVDFGCAYAEGAPRACDSDG